MILLTVGTQLPFDRLVQALDTLAPQLAEPILAQVGRSIYAAKNFACIPSMSPREFDDNFQKARLIVSHAGIGTILSAKKHRKPIILFPRRAALGEHRNDHQMATAKALAEVRGCYVAWDDDKLEQLLKHRDLQTSSLDASPRREALISGLRSFIQDSER